MLRQSKDDYRHLPPLPRLMTGIAKVQTVHGEVVSPIDVKNVFYVFFIIFIKTRV